MDLEKMIPLDSRDPQASLTSLELWDNRDPLARLTSLELWDNLDPLDQDLHQQRRSR